MQLNCASYSLVQITKVNISNWLTITNFFMVSCNYIVNLHIVNHFLCMFNMYSN